MDLEERVKELERQVRELQARPVYVPAPVFVPQPGSSPSYPNFVPYSPYNPWWQQYTVTCGGNLGINQHPNQA
jgi:hypothetical protein